MRNIILLTLLFLVSKITIAQETQLFKLIENKKFNQEFKKVNLLTESINSEIFKNGFEKANEVNSFQLNNEAINKLDANIIIDLNVGHEILSLELVEYNINDFNLRTNDNKILKPNKSIRHYRGAVNGDPKSLVALSMYENKLNGIVSTSNNEYNLVY